VVHRAHNQPVLVSRRNKEPATDNFDNGAFLQAVEVEKLGWTLAEILQAKGAACCTALLALSGPSSEALRPH
jgi:hypothetical protein